MDESVATVAGSFELLARPGHPDFLDLPWSEPLRSWSGPRLVDVARGVSRHVVRFIDYDGLVYAMKELPVNLAEREYGLLRELLERNIPVVEAVGVVTGRRDEHGEELDSILITRHLAFSLPYRHLFVGRTVKDLQSRFLDAMALLLVRLHAEGFFWGDCSLSNTLFRRDAGALTAYLVDAETGKLQPRMSNGQREHDLMLAGDNVGGELLDLVAAGRVGQDFDPAAVVEDLRLRYDRLWDELHHVELVEPGNRLAINRRIRRLNELGFDVGEFSVSTTDDGRQLKVVPRVVENGHHQRRLHQLTGLDTDENQARRLLNDIDEHRANLEEERGRKVPEALAAYSWLSDVYEPILERIPPELRGRLAPPELYHQFLEHRWFVSEQADRDVGTELALADYVENVLRYGTDEAAVLPPPLEDQDEIDGLLTSD